MEKNEDIDIENDALSKLVDLKLPLVLRDYQSYFEAISRDINIILMLKGWELSLISALVVFLLTKNNNSITLISILPLYIIVGFFWLLDCRTQLDKLMRKKDAIEKEQKLQETNLETFQKNIILWEFAETKEDKWNYHKIKDTIKYMGKLETFVWHFPLLIIITLLYCITLFIK